MRSPLAYLRHPKASPVLACVLALALGLGFTASTMRHGSRFQRGGDIPVLVEFTRADVARVLAVMLAGAPEVAAFAPTRLLAASPAHGTPLAFALRCIPPPQVGA